MTLDQYLAQLRRIDEMINAARGKLEALTAQRLQWESMKHC